MTKAQALILALVAATSSAVTIGAKELLAEKSNVVYRAHGIDLRQPQLDDGSVPTAMAYTTALTPLADGGIGMLDLSGHACPITKDVVDCARALLAHGATEACR